MNRSFSANSFEEGVGTLNSGKQLEGLVTLGMRSSHKALCPDPVTAGSGLFFVWDVARAAVYLCSTNILDNNSSRSI
jgi:hypothetical protein